MNLGRRASFLLPLSLVGCKRTRSAQSVSEAFIDEYYIERNPKEALALTTALAAKRVEGEKQLLDQAGAQDYGGVQPRVFYNQLKSEPVDDRVQMTYALTIDSAGVKLQKEVRMDIVKVGEEYRVAFFNERDVAGAPP
jgi:hypothetical protein